MALANKLKCIASYCSNTSELVHGFPKDEKRKNIWAERAGVHRNNINNHFLLKGRNTFMAGYGLCSSHFPAVYFVPPDYKTLVDYALPEIFQNENGDVVLYKRDELEETLLEQNNYEQETEDQHCKNDDVHEINNILEFITGEPHDEHPRVQEENEGGCDWNINQERYSLVSELCRVCAKPGINMISVFESQGQKLNLLEKIHIHLPILVTEDDILPSHLCGSCITQLENSHRLYNRCLEADTKLKTILGYAPSPKNVDQQEEYTIEQVNEESFTIQIKEERVFANTANILSENEMENSEIIVIENPSVKNTNEDTQPIINEVVVDNEKKSKSSPNQCLKKSDSQELPEIVKEKLEKINKKKNPNAKVVVVKLKNTKNLPPEAQIQKALKLMNKAKHEPEKEKEEKNIPEITINDDAHTESIEKFIAKPTDSLQIPSTPAINKSPRAPSTEKAACEQVMGCDPEGVPHVITRFKEALYLCMFCNKTIAGKESLVQHQKELHPDRVTTCAICNRVVYGDEDQQKAHAETHKSACDSQGMEQLIQPIPYIQISAGENNNQYNNNDESANMVPTASQNSIKNPIMTRLHRKILLDTSTTESIKKKRRGWRCRICEQVFPNKDDLKKHKDTHPPRVWNCTYCSKTFSNKCSREQHERIHTNVKPFICEYCGKSFRVNQMLRNHLYTHDVLEKKFDCKLCNKRFSSKSGWNAHQISHSNEAKFLCDLCGKSFRHEGNLRLHKRNHQDPQSLYKHTCDVCGKTYQTKFRLREHYRTHTNERPFECNICEKKFHKFNQLKQHQAIHINARKHKCHICGKGFNRRGNMVIHSQRHLKNQLLCKICGDMFTSLKELLAHRNSHPKGEIDAVLKELSEKGNENVFECQECGKFLSSKVSFKSHMMIHTGIRPFQCTQCEKNFAVKAVLDKHMLSHTGEKPYTCEYCTEGFTTRTSLVVHVRRHTGEKPYKCTKCVMAFRSRMNLTQHEIVHSDKRPFKCENCDKTFRRRDALKTHIRTHTGEKPFACPICSRQFRQKGDCNKHLRTHYKDKLVPIGDESSSSVGSGSTITTSYPCGICGQLFGFKEELENHYESVHATDLNTADTIVIDADNLISMPEISLVSTELYIKSEDCSP